MDSKFNALIKNYSTISTDIENKANQLEDAYSNQPSTTAYNAVYQGCVEAMSSLLKHTETLCMETTKLLNVHENSIQQLSDDVGGLLLEMTLNREMCNRKIIGERTIVKQQSHASNVVLPTEPFVVNKVINTSLDISRYDGVGHGATHSSKVPATKSTTVELHIPSNVNGTIYKELNELNFDANCKSSFWRSENITNPSQPYLMPTLSASDARNRSTAQKGTKRASTSSYKGTLNVKKNSTFRHRNSLTIRASAPNDISEDIYNSMLSVKLIHASVTNISAGSMEENLFGVNPNDLSVNIRTYEDSRSDTQISGASFRAGEIASVGYGSFANSKSFSENENPLKFPTPTNTMSSGSTPLETPISGSNISTVTSSKPNYLYKARVLYDYEKTLDDELTISTDNVVEVIEEGDDGWCVARFGALVGSVPGNYLEKI